MTPDVSEVIANAFVDIITNRKGLRHVWENIDEDVQTEIMNEMKERARAAIISALGL